MKKRDLYDNIAAVQLLKPQDLAHTTTASAILDTAQMAGAEVQVSIAALTGVDGSNYVTPVLQESDTTTGADFTAVSAGDIIGGFSKVDSTAKDECIQRAGYTGGKRYIRVNLVYTGTAITAGVIGVTGVLAYPQYAPVVSPAPITAG